MPQALKVFFVLLVLWQSAYIFSVGLWEKKRSNRAGSVACLLVILTMLAALAAALAA